jgi:hypothetical protein
MARTSFTGPILTGSIRQGALRNVGYTTLTQSAVLDLSVTNAATANYAGASTIFVTNNYVNGGSGQNLAANVYTPSASVYPSIVQAIPADAATRIYRGVVMYLPFNSTITAINISCGVVPAVAGGTAVLTTLIPYVSNNYTAAAGTPTYALTSAVTAVGSQALTAATVTELANLNATSTDILQANAPSLSQVVFTLAIVGTTLTSATSLAGLFYLNVQYTQADNNLGNSTTYPYLVAD